jgi:hypothetical protein
LRRIDEPEDDRPLWLPEEDGWDSSEWGYDDPWDRPSLYSHDDRKRDRDGDRDG